MKAKKVFEMIDPYASEDVDSIDLDVSYKNKVIRKGIEEWMAIHLPNETGEWEITNDLVVDFSNRKRKYNLMISQITDLPFTIKIDDVIILSSPKLKNITGKIISSNLTILGANEDLDLKNMIATEYIEFHNLNLSTIPETLLPKKIKISSCKFDNLDFLKNREIDELTIEVENDIVELPEDLIIRDLTLRVLTLQKFTNIKNLKLLNFDNVTLIDRFYEPINNKFLLFNIMNCKLPNLPEKSNIRKMILYETLIDSKFFPEVDFKALRIIDSCNSSLWHFSNKMKIDSLEYNYLPKNILDNIRKNQNIKDIIEI